VITSGVHFALASLRSLVAADPPEAWQQRSMAWGDDSFEKVFMTFYLCDQLECILNIKMIEVRSWRILAGGQ